MRQKRREKEKTGKELHGDWEDGGCGDLGDCSLQMPSMPEKKGHLWGRCGELEGEALSPLLGARCTSLSRWGPRELGAWLEGGAGGKAFSSINACFLPCAFFLLPPPCCHPPVPQTAAQQRQTFQVPQLPPCVHGCRLIGGTPGYAHGETRQGLHLLHLQPGLHLGECLLSWGAAEVDTLPRE